MTWVCTRLPQPCSLLARFLEHCDPLKDLRSILSSSSSDRVPNTIGWVELARWHWLDAAAPHGCIGEAVAYPALAVSVCTACRSLCTLTAILCDIWPWKQSLQGIP
jgi:hypothetical protein